MFGKIKDYIIRENKVYFNFESGQGIIEIIASSIINVFSPLKCEQHNSKAIEKLSIEKTEFETERKCNFIEIKTSELIVKVFDDFKVDFYNKDGQALCEDYRKGRNPFIRRGKSAIIEEEGHEKTGGFEKHKIEVMKKIFGDEKFYGLGDKTGHLNKRDCYYENWNTDNPRPHVESFKSLYKTIPFFITLRKSASFGIFFDNTFKSYFDMGKENSEYYYFGADDGNLDYYFIAGQDISQVISGYTKLTGTTPLPQRWTLGYQQSRFSYTPEERILEVAGNFRKNKIPCDVLHLDIDYMDNYKVFTWDKNKFSDERKTIEKLSRDGFKVVTIIDPGVKKEKGYSIYDEGLKNEYFAVDKDGIAYVNKVWPGDAVYPDFTMEETRKWWGDNHRKLLDAGVAGIWNDMNEPAGFNGPIPDSVQFKNDGNPSDHSEIHNVYGHLMSKAAYEGLKRHTGKRPFVITRACYAGTQKYSTVWTGDNQSFWEHLRMAVPMLLNLGLSGIAFCGTDVGGFSFDCTAELLCRWTQLGAFSPLFRNHSSIKTRDQEPWSFDEETLNITRKYIKLRYKLIPYIYDLMWQCENTGLPVMRPLVLHYAEDENTHEINDEFLLGENMLIAPIVEQGKRYRGLYLPEGRWTDYWTGEIMQGGKYLIKEAPLDICPIYIKSGSIIPNYPNQNYIGEKKIDELILDIYPGEGRYIHYNDDGESFEYKNGKYVIYDFNMENQTDTFIRIKKSGKDCNYRTFKVIYNSSNVREVYFNNSKIIFEKNDKAAVFNIPAEDGKLNII